MLACPKCNSYMFPAKKRGVNIDCCSQCQGLWLDSGELAELAKTFRDLPERQTVVATATALACPRCSNKMETEPYSADADLMVDTCTDCRGVYLDKGELERVQALVKQIDEIFTADQLRSMSNKAQRKEALSTIYKADDPAAKHPANERTKFVKDVYALLIATLLVTAAGSYFGLSTGYGVKYFTPAMITEVVLFITALCVRRTPVVNFITLFAYTFTTGLTVSAVLASYAAEGLGAVVWQAGIITGVIFVVLTASVQVSGKDFTWLGGMLYVSLILLVIAGIGFFFWHSQFALFMWSCLGALVFTGFILYDTSNIMLKYSTEEAISAVLELYLDIINLFFDLLRVLAYLHSKS